MNWKTRFFSYGLFVALCISVSTVSANITNPFFNDHMVLQRQMLVPVFGKADVGEKVTVTFRGQTKMNTADANGKWMVKLDSMEAGGPFQLVLTGKNTVTISDVMVGEVWIGSGQSNMEMGMDGAYNANGAAVADSAKKADYPNFRVMGPAATNGVWRVCTPANILSFSELGYFFGRDLQIALKIPVGMVVSAVGGTEVERWLEPDFISKDTALSNPAFRTQNNLAGDLFKARIAPLIPMAFRGALWYQGESNEWNSQFYLTRFAGLVKGWRKVWGQGDFPFYFVQLASYRTLQVNPVEASGWCDIREAQRLSLALPNSGMATAIDIGEAGDIHPKNKWDIGYRFSLTARALVYNESNLVYSGPMFKSSAVEGNKIRLQFSQLGGGLKSKDGGALKGFAIAGADGKWVWGSAVVDNASILVSAATVTSPTQVRYSWSANPIGNLVNLAGLPASSFKTDGAQLPVVLARVERKPRVGFGWHRWLGLRDLVGRKVNTSLAR